MTKAEIAFINAKIAFHTAEIEHATDMLSVSTDSEEREALVEFIIHERFAIATLPKVPSDWDEHTVVCLEADEADRSFGRFDGPEVFFA